MKLVLGRRKVEKVTEAGQAALPRPTEFGNQEWDYNSSNVFEENSAEKIYDSF